MLGAGAAGGRCGGGGGTDVLGLVLVREAGVEAWAGVSAGGPACSGELHAAAKPGGPAGGARGRGAYRQSRT